CQQEIDWSLTF
nr:immunoglobulin light chain junction region [Macaca mulatta]